MKEDYRVQPGKVVHYLVGSTTDHTWWHPVIFLLIVLVLISACVCRRPSWTPKTQPGGSSAATWLSFWCSTRLLIPNKVYGVVRTMPNCFIYPWNFPLPSFPRWADHFFTLMTPNLACLMIRLKLNVKIPKMALLVSRLKMIRLLKFQLVFGFYHLESKTTDTLKKHLT